MSDAAAVQVANQPATGQSLVARIAQRFGVEPNKMLATLKATAFKSDREITNEAMMALLIVAETYRLNPFTRELFAYPDKNGGIVPVVSVDGWSRIINDSPQLDGIEFQDGPLDKNNMPEWIECIIHRKDRAHPTRVREYMAECKRSTGPWGSHPRRMLRHRAMMQCARVAFAFSGIYDEDEALRIVEGKAADGVEDILPISSINKNIRGKTVFEGEAQRIEADENQTVAQEIEPAIAATVAASAKYDAPAPSLFGEQQVTAIDAIAAFAGHSSADTLDLYMDGLTEAIKADPRVVKAFKARRDELQNAASAKKK